MRFKKLYALSHFNKSVELKVNILRLPGTVKLIWHQGQIGAIPIFKYKKDSLKAAKKMNCKIIEFEEVNEIS